MVDSQNYIHVYRILDAIWINQTISEHGGILRSAQGYLERNLQQFSVKDKARLFRLYAFAKSKSFTHYSLLGRLGFDLKERISDLEELDVLNVMQGLGVLKDLDMTMFILYKRLTETVTELAEKNVELVSVAFVMNCMKYYAKVSRPMREPHVKVLSAILQEKLKEEGSGMPISYTKRLGEVCETI